MSKDYKKTTFSPVYDENQKIFVDILHVYWFSRRRERIHRRSWKQHIYFVERTKKKSCLFLA